MGATKKSATLSIRQAATSRKPAIRSVVAVVALVVLGLAAFAVSKAWSPEDALRPVIRQVRLAAVWLAGPPRLRRLAGDGKPATEIWLNDPVALVEDADGNLYFGDRGSTDSMIVRVGRFIWRIDAQGIAEVIAGTGARATPEDGAPALATPLGEPSSLAFDGEGRLYVADPYNHIVVRIEKDGRLTWVAGTGEPGDDGDGGPALEAKLNLPYEVDFDDAGNLYIADYASQRVRVVAPDGTIETAVGTGTPGYSGDGGPATEARLNGVYGMRVHPDGRLLISDTDNHVVRQVGLDGIITTIAGTGEAGNSGDGGPAVEARLSAPESIFVADDGRIYVGDEANHNIRVIDLDGTIHTLAGDGAPGFAQVGRPFATTPLNDPESFLIRADGTMVIADGDSGRLLTRDDTGDVAIYAGPASRSVGDAMRLYGDQDPKAREAYERRLREAGLTP